jgi:DeoR/GlpR family transcriptional regulator of sugar metabolism
MWTGIEPQGNATALKSLPAGRKANLAAYVYKQGQVTVTELAEQFNVSADTIRRDLDELSSENFLIRTHGGAISPTLIPKPDSNLDIRTGIQIARKEAIGKAAASLISNNSVVLMNSGTTVLAVVKALSNHTGLTIATNNLHITYELVASSVRALHVFGGTVLLSSQATIGPVTLATVGGENLEIECDIALIAVGGVSIDGGYSVSNFAEASMFKEMMKRAKKVAILADATKINVKHFAKLSDLSEADYFVTDIDPPKEVKDALMEANVEIILPKKDKPLAIA